MGENLETNNASDMENQNQENSQNVKLSYDEMVERINAAETRALEAEAKVQDLTSEHEKTVGELDSTKEKLNARLTAEERAENAKDARTKALEEEVKKLRNESRITNYSKRYMGVGMDEKTATELAGLTGEIAEPDKFFSALDKFVKASLKKAGEDSVEALVKSNPSIKAGNGDGDKESEAVRLAKESAARRQNKGFNEDALKQWM